MDHFVPNLSILWVKKIDSGNMIIVYVSPVHTSLNRFSLGAGNKIQILFVINFVFVYRHPCCF